MKSFLFPAALLLGLLATVSARALDVQEPAVKSFIKQMVDKHHYPQQRLLMLLKNTAIDPAIIQTIEHPAEALPWYKYRRIFLTQQRIAAGRAFLAAHSAALDHAWNRYGVPPEIITALLGMESFYGQQEGSHLALTALATLAFHYPPRASFFRKELTDYFLLCRRNGLDPATLKASYAGALGAGQFMPSSYLAYAVDADGGGSDLFTHWADITASIAHYLAKNGWHAGQPTAAPAAVPRGFKDDSTDSESTVGHLHAKGIVFHAPVPATTPVMLVKVMTSDGPKYWVGLPNFTVLMRYNRSPLYALAAAQLAGEIQAAPPSADSHD